MKTYLSLFLNKYLYLIGFCLLFSSCDEDKVLTEVPKGFLSPENTFVNKEGFQSALTNLYRIGRGLRTVELLSGEGDKALSAMEGSGTDIGFYWDKKLNFSDYSLINSSNAFVRDYWVILFGMVKDANVIISRLPASPLSSVDKATIEAEARFFRAYSYRFLTYLWGDVPKIDIEFTGPKSNFVRTPKKEILAFMIEDLEFAAKNLPIKNSGNGKLSAAAANHILAETYIANGEYDKAIAAASKVIDDSQYSLMKTRFGKHTAKPGDVFWDMFRIGNQNGNTGNKEAILVWQMEFGINGGTATYALERTWGPLIQNLRDSKNQSAILPADSLGRGVGFLIPNAYFSDDIWKSDFKNDIRNSPYNMQRVFYNNNPASIEFGKVIVPRAVDIPRNHYVWLKKAASPKGHPQGYDQSGRLYTDIYAIRLAETYLLRAEAYLGKNDKVNAAIDINVVRSRAKASEAKAADVDINYLLDERARELTGEELRRLTLARMGLLVERTKKYNPISASTIQSFHNLLPIPQSVIDANTETKFPQNSGYN